MVSYSFQRQFVDPIKVGLGLLKPDPHRIILPKRQTIRRVGQKRHARQGEEIQLYYAQRTKHCAKIGEAICTRIEPINIRFHGGNTGDVRIGNFDRIVKSDDLDLFAQADGFEGWFGLRSFWALHHPGVTDFEGVIVFWSPRG